MPRVVTNQSGGGEQKVEEDDEIREFLDQAGAVKALRAGRYVGEQRKNQIREGFGTYVFRNGFFRYDGEWMNGQMHGTGKMTMRDGSYCEGQFYHGEINGHGIKYSAISGDLFEGQLVNGEIEGKGVLKAHNGDMYEGDFVSYQKEGVGKMIYADTSVYEGEFHNNMRHSEGVQKYANGDVYQGFWVQDKRMGHGLMSYSGVGEYEGQFMLDMRHGEGVYRQYSGLVYSGLWYKNLPKQMPTAISIISDALRVDYRSSFSVVVNVVDGEGACVENESGRTLKVQLGCRYDKPAETALDENSSSEDLLNVIETEACEVIETPFGYSVMPYPLTESQPEWSQSAAASESESSLGNAAAGTSETQVASDGIMHSPRPPTLQSSDAGIIAWPQLFLSTPPVGYLPFQSKLKSGQDLLTGEYVLMIEDVTQAFLDTPLPTAFAKIVVFDGDAPPTTDSADKRKKQKTPIKS